MARSPEHICHQASPNPGGNRASTRGANRRGRCPRVAEMLGPGLLLPQDTYGQKGRGVRVENTRTRHGLHGSDTVAGVHVGQEGLEDIHATEKPKASRACPVVPVRRIRSWN